MFPTKPQRHFFKSRVSTWTLLTALTVMRSSFSFHLISMYGKIRLTQFKNLFKMSFSPINLFEKIPRTTNRTCGSWLRRLGLQGQSGPQWICSPSLVSPHPRKLPWTHTSLRTDIQRLSAVPLVPRSSSMLFVGCYLRWLSKSFSLSSTVLLLARCVLCVACLFGLFGHWNRHMVNLSTFIILDFQLIPVIPLLFHSFQALKEMRNSLTPRSKGKLTKTEAT